MSAPPVRGCALRAGLALALLAAGAHAAAAAPPGRPAVERRRTEGSVERPRALGVVSRPAWRSAPWRRAAPPTAAQTPVAASEHAFLIYLIDGGDPIVVSRYVEENGQVLFEKYGGWVRIPTFEILKIVPDQPDPADRTVNLPPSTPLAATWGAPLRPESEFYVTMRGGGNLRVAAFRPEGDRVRVSVGNGTFTVPRSEIMSVVRVPPGSDVPEAWLSILVTEGDDTTGGPVSSGLLPPAPDPRFPYQSSDRPHYLRLGNGQLMRVEGFWVEDGEFRFRRLGGIVGVALNEIARLFPEEIAPVRGRTPVRFVQRVEPGLLEVSVRSGYHRVRLVGVEPASGSWSGESPWLELERGMIIYLEFDRQRYDAQGNWLAYVFLPNGRMLNAELIRIGLGRPAPDGRNFRYLDLFHEMAAAGPADAGPEAERE